jgi:hypothetical protein
VTPEKLLRRAQARVSKAGVLLDGAAADVRAAGGGAVRRALARVVDDAGRGVATALAGIGDELAAERPAAAPPQREVRAGWPSC